MPACCRKDRGLRRSFQPDVPPVVVRRPRRTVLQLQAAGSDEQRLHRVGKILGEAFAEQAVYIEHETEGVALSGWLALPTFNRSQPDMQYWFVNGRSISDRTLALVSNRLTQPTSEHGLARWLEMDFVCDRQGQRWLLEVREESERLANSRPRLRVKDGQ